MLHDATGKLLNNARRRLWLQGLIDRGWLGLMLTSGILGLIAVLHTFFMTMAITWWGPAALLPVAVAIIVTVFKRPSLEASARAFDRWLNTSDLLSAAYYLRSQSLRSTSVTAPVVLEQADQLARNAPSPLPHVRKTRHPAPTAMAIAVAATSLFFLSLQGATPSGGISTTGLDDSRARNQTEQDNWLSVLKPGLPDASDDDMSKQAKQESGNVPFGTSNETPLQASPDREVSEQDEPDPGTQSNTLQEAKGAGAGRLASNESATSEPGRGISDGTVKLTDLEIVALQRKPTGEAGAMDSTTSGELIAFDIQYHQPETVAQDVTAARAGKEQFSLSVGPAFRALQTRYFEETSQND